MTIYLVVVTNKGLSCFINVYRVHWRTLHVKWSMRSVLLNSFSSGQNLDRTSNMNTSLGTQRRFNFCYELGLGYYSENDGKSLKDSLIVIYWAISLLDFCNIIYKEYDKN